jgi:hypothetical protein
MTTMLLVRRRHLRAACRGAARGGASRATIRGFSVTASPGAGSAAVKGVMDLLVVAVVVVVLVMPAAREGEEEEEALNMSGGDKRYIALYVRMGGRLGGLLCICLRVSACACIRVLQEKKHHVMIFVIASCQRLRKQQKHGLSIVILVFSPSCMGEC